MNSTMASLLIGSVMVFALALTAPAASTEEPIPEHGIAGDIPYSKKKGEKRGQATFCAAWESSG